MTPQLEALAGTIPVLETPRLRLVAPTLEFLDPERDFYVSSHSRFVGGPIPRHRVWRITALQLGHWALNGYGMWAVIDKARGAAVGGVSIWGPEPWPEPEVGYHLYEGEEGKGYATEAAAAAMRWWFGPMGGTTLTSMIDPQNAASQAVARRLGGYNTGETFASEPDSPEKTVDIWRYDAAPEVPA